MPFIPLTEKEEQWIRGLARALTRNEEFTEPAPTEHCIVYVLKHIK